MSCSLFRALTQDEYDAAKVDLTTTIQFVTQLVPVNIQNTHSTINVHLCRPILPDTHQPLLCSISQKVKARVIELQENYADLVLGEVRNEGRRGVVKRFNVWLKRQTFTHQQLKQGLRLAAPKSVGAIR